MTAGKVTAGDGSATGPEDASHGLPSIIVQLDEVRRSPARITLDLNEDERGALAALHDLPQIDAFDLKATVHTAGKRQMRAEGRMRATVHYRCAVTLEPFGADIDVSFDDLFSADLESQAAIDIDALSETDVEPLVDGALDVADLAFQHFALALDPYPRHPSLPPLSDRDQPSAEEGAERRKASPFAVLEHLKNPGT